MSTATTASEYYSTKDDGLSAVRGSKKQTDKSSPYYTDDDTCLTRSSLRSSGYLGGVYLNYKEDNVDGRPEKKEPVMARYRRELARTRKQKRKIPFLYLNEVDTLCAFFLISTLIWLARQLVH